MFPAAKLESVDVNVAPLAVTDFRYGVVTKNGLTVTGIETSLVPSIE